MAFHITPMEGVMTEKLKVFVAGTSGSGKTTFLVSMYNRMSAELHELVGEPMIVSNERFSEALENTRTGRKIFGRNPRSTRIS